MQSTRICGFARPIHRGGIAVLLVFAAWAAVLPRVTRAQEEQADPNLPLLVINVASVDRLLNQAVVAFEAAERPELAETLSGALARVNDLKGLDRGQSMGVMLFLNGLTPEPVGYVPVKNFDDFIKTAEIGPLTAKNTGEGRFELVGRRQTLYGRILGDYAFIANSASGVDREFRDPAVITGRLSRSYDVAVTASLRSLAPTTRDLFLAMLRASTENDLQRRDTEPETAHRLRKAAGLRNLEAIEQLVTQGDELTIGWSLSSEDKKGTLEAVLTAIPNSEFAAYFNELKGHRSRFANLLTDHNPLVASIAWRFDKSARKMFKEIVAAVEAQLLRDLGMQRTAAPAEGDETPAAATPVEQFAKVFQATIDAGSLDAAVQIVGQPPGPFVLVGGVKIADAATLSGAISEILAGLKGNQALSEVQLNYTSHEGIAFHRLQFRRASDSNERVFGADAALLVGVADDVMWLGFGGNEAMSELKRAVDRLKEPVAESVTSAPFQFVMNFSHWMDVFDPQNRPEGFAALARDSFSRGGDALRVEARPTDDGIRLKVTLNEAFIRLIGQQVSRQIDQNEQPDEPGENAPDDANAP